jgi:PAS domain S-box-containing protein
MPIGMPVHGSTRGPIRARAVADRDIAIAPDSDRFRCIVEAAPAAILMVDRAGIVEMANADAERILGFPRGTLAGQRAELLLPDGMGDGNPFDSAAFLRSDSDRRHVMLQARRGDGSMIPVEVGVSPIETADGPMLLAVVSDISERVTAGQRLASHRAELQRSNEELATFAYVASHDLKSPLRAISQLASWIDQDVGEARFDAVPGYVKLMHQRLRRMESLLDDLLAYSRVGKTRGGLAHVSVAELARGIFDTEMPPTAIRLELAAGLPSFTTWASPFAQVLRNLFSNAIKHHDRSEGTIRLAGTAAGEGRLTFTVSDDGPGIAPQYHERVFGMFQTLRPRDEVEGSGMGLAMVKKIIEGFGGTIRIDPQPGRGCCMIFTWPSNLGETLGNDHSATS